MGARGWLRLQARAPSRLARVQGSSAGWNRPSKLEAISRPQQGRCGRHHARKSEQLRRSPSDLEAAARLTWEEAAAKVKRAERQGKVEARLITRGRVCAPRASGAQTPIQQRRGCSRVGQTVPRCSEVDRAGSAGTPGLAAESSCSSSTVRVLLRPSRAGATPASRGCSASSFRL